MSAKIVKRSGLQQDRELIVNSWLRGQYHGTPFWSMMEKELFYSNYISLINSILDTGTVDVAVLDDDPSTILSVLVTKGSTVFWAYTKKDYRNQGLITFLAKGKTIDTTASTTLPGAAIAKKKKLTFNPFLMTGSEKI